MTKTIICDSELYALNRVRKILLLMLTMTGVAEMTVQCYVYIVMSTDRLGHDTLSLCIHF